ncbi:hypothetical protein HPB48_009576 [Haemaphysalis longicornis]|uniref:Uncharacterized protein n=1 Tax=Haemaphysalis longicornis TaxID=44386 RepID=A0A9J6FBA5_HAELO|nr:hypothetical protein HPB48_009576 [Haemaphysalis longicornis]
MERSCPSLLEPVRPSQPGLAPSRISQRCSDSRAPNWVPKKRAAAIIFTDELNAIGNERFESKAGGRKVQRTMLELSQLDGFSSSADISDRGNRPG